MLASFISFYGPVMKKKQFLKSCLKPTHIKSLPCWILEQFLIWDDENNFELADGKMLSPTLLFGIEWIIHKYHHSPSLFGKAPDSKTCCTLCGEVALHTGVMA